MIGLSFITQSLALINPMPEVSINLWKSPALPILAEFLRIAAHEDHIQTVYDNQSLHLYIKDFREPHFVAVAARNNDDKVVGLAWMQPWASDNRGFAYVAPDIPELTIAVLPDYQGQGIGGRLLDEMQCGSIVAQCAQ